VNPCLVFVAAETMLDAQTFNRCAIVGNELLKRGFNGDFERLLAWWRAEKAQAARAEASAAPATLSGAGAAERRRARPRRGGTIGV